MLSCDNFSQLLLFLFLGNIVIGYLVQINNLYKSLKIIVIDSLGTYLFVSPHQVGLRVAGVMDHHLLLSNAAVTATRGAADGVVLEEYNCEEGGQDM